MTSVDFLLLVRGPLFAAAAVVMAFGITLRLFEIFMLGRKANLAAKRASGTGAGFRTMFRRFVPVDKSTFSQSVLLTLAGIFGLRAGCICVVSDRTPWPGPSEIEIDKNMDACIAVAADAMLRLVRG